MEHVEMTKRELTKLDVDSLLGFNRIGDTSSPTKARFKGWYRESIAPPRAIVEVVDEGWTMRLSMGDITPKGVFIFNEVAYRLCEWKKPEEDNKLLFDTPTDLVEYLSEEIGHEPKLFIVRSAIAEDILGGMANEELITLIRDGGYPVPYTWAGVFDYIMECDDLEYIINKVLKYLKV